MIEVEKKFLLKSGDQEKLILGAEFLREETIQDDYYDTTDWALALKDTWLRSRNGAWELKVPLNSSGSDTRLADQYRELTTDREISEYLGLPINIALSETLQEAGYLRIAPIQTKRLKYKQGKFVIDIDAMNFGYEIAEIELLVEKIIDIPAAVEKILTLAKSIGLATVPVRGKVIEYIRRAQPERFKKLAEAGVV